MGDKPCAPCSTLESMAWQCAHLDGDICAVMDARRNQVYAARFRACQGMITRLSEDRAVGLDELAEEVRKRGGMQILVGDGAKLCHQEFEARGISNLLMPPHLLYQTAWGVARAALRLAQEGGLVSGEVLAPMYHRMSQAERERLERMKSVNQGKGF